MKTVLIAKSNTSPWVSCQSITANLIKLYQSRSKDEGCEVVHLDEGDSFYDLQKKVDALYQAGVQRIVFLDHHPHPKEFLEILCLRFTQPHTLELVFHLFGDFTLFCVQWQAAETCLRHFKVRWVCASVNQAKLVSRLLDQEQACVDVVPFPVDHDFYHFSEDARKKFRSRYGLTEKSKGLLYTGRLSLQKNVIELVKIFDSLKEVFAGDDLRLFLAGGFDDLNLPFIGKSGLKGSFFHLWQKECGSALSRETIVLLGQCDAEQLKQAYCGADIFVSLSTHNDEDFGMSPAEALLSGLPMLLTQWGGYPCFKTDEAVSLVGVDFSNEARVTPLTKEAQKSLSRIIFEDSFTPDQRADLSRQRSKEFALQSLGPVLDKVLSSEAQGFTGFNLSFSRLCSHFKANAQAPFANANGGHNDFYRELYQVYTQGERIWKK